MRRGKKTLMLMLVVMSLLFSNVQTIPVMARENVVNQEEAIIYKVFFRTLSVGQTYTMKFDVPWSFYNGVDVSGNNVEVKARGARTLQIKALKKEKLLLKEPSIPIIN